MKTIREQITETFKQAFIATLGEAYADLSPLLQSAARPEYGDYQANFAMKLAKARQQSPREVAALVIGELRKSDQLTHLDCSGPGFINFSLSDPFLEAQLQQLAQDDRLGVEPLATTQKVIIDYSGPNVAKEMHVGHLRSTIIGDAIARVLGFVGYEIIRQNHIGDWGTQFGMLIQYMLDEQWEYLPEHTISDLNRLYKQSKARFDSDPDFADRARLRVVKLQGGDQETYALWCELVKISQQHYQDVFKRLGVLLRPEDNCGESFYNDRLPELTERLEREGLATIDQDALVMYLPDFLDREDNPLPFMLRKSDGGYLYSTTDLAGMEYRLTHLQGERIIYVTDARQKQHFAMLFAAARKAGWITPEIRLDHVPFGTILGKDQKPFKTRSGDTIQLTRLIDEAVERATTLALSKNPDLDSAQQQAIGECIGIGALKYADLSTDKVKDYVFDWDQMLNFEGNTAPYLQNAYVRVQSIFRKGEIDPATLEKGSYKITTPAEHQLSVKLLEFPTVIVRIADDLALHRLCQYLFEVACAFHKFYEACPVLTAEDQSVRDSRLQLCQLAARILKQGLDLLGISVVEQM